MHKLIECDEFHATVYRDDKVHQVVVFGFGVDGFGNFFKVERRKDFNNAKDCLDFLYFNSEMHDSPSLDDFDYYSQIVIMIDYFNCGVDFDED